MKTLNIIIAATAALTLAAIADPVVVQPVVVPPQPTRIAPLILAPSDAMTTIAQIQANNNTVSLSGSTVSVNPPYGMLVTTGSNAGKIAVFLSVRPAPATK